jgi:hypothetical protein
MIIEKIVSMSTNPPKSPERAAEIREMGVRFPVKVKMWLRRFI